MGASNSSLLNPKLGDMTDIFKGGDLDAILKGGVEDVGIGEIGLGIGEAAGGLAGIGVYDGLDVYDSIKRKQDRDKENTPPRFDWPPVGQKLPTGPIGPVGPIIFPDPFRPPTPTVGPQKPVPDLPDQPTTGGGGAIPAKRPTGEGDDGKGTGEGGQGGIGGGGTGGQGGEGTKSPDDEPEQPGPQPDEEEDEDVEEDDEEEDDEDDKKPPPEDEQEEKKKDKTDTDKHKPFKIKKVNTSLLQKLKKIPKEQIQLYDIYDENIEKESNKADVIIAEEVKNETREKQITAQKDDFIKYHSHSIPHDKYIVRSYLQFDKIREPVNIYDLPSFINKNDVFTQVQQQIDEDNKDDQYDFDLKPTYEKDYSNNRTVDLF